MEDRCVLCHDKVEKGGIRRHEVLKSLESQETFENIYNVCEHCARSIAKQYIALYWSGKDSDEDGILSKYKVINVEFKTRGDDNPRTVDVKTAVGDKIRYYRDTYEMPVKSRWTPTSEFMPPKEGEYIVTYIDPNIGPHVTIARYVDDKFMKDGEELKNVTAWNKKQLPYDEDN